MQTIHFRALVKLVEKCWDDFCEYSGGEDSAETSLLGLRAMIEMPGAPLDDRIDIPPVVMLAEEFPAQFAKLCGSDDAAEQTVDALKDACGMI